MEPFTGSLSGGIASATELSPTYRRAEVLLQRMDLEVERARDRTRPQMDLNVRVGVSGIGGSYADDVEVLGDADGRNWLGSVALGFPLGRNPDRERYRQRLLEKERDQVDLERLRLDIVRQVREQYRRVHINFRRAQISQLAERLAKQNVTEEEARLTLGVSTVRHVLDAQDDLAESRASRLGSIVEYNKALVEWRRLTAK